MEQFEKLSMKQGIDKLSNTIEELDDKGKNKKPAVNTAKSL